MGLVEQIALLVAVVLVGAYAALLAARSHRVDVQLEEHRRARLDAGRRDDEREARLNERVDRLEERVVRLEERFGGPYR